MTSLLGRDAHSAEDVVQETLLRAWQQADRLDFEHRPVRMWLFRVARNLVVDLHRRDGRTVAVGLGPSDYADAVTEPDPADQITDRLLLVDALRNLPSAQREVLARVHLLGHPGEVVADVLGVPVGTVKSRTHKGVRSARAALARHGCVGVAA
ncbi:sigma-70 family RNA polymerase sigma factor [Kribbella sp. CA-253562]|uniref:sigma-70 family RNA polymerase sigma factor n=1 Tax=Kribbella sp. CA-253562 TaxID=3239942 RepID=UPI003D90B113